MSDEVFESLDDTTRSEDSQQNDDVEIEESEDDQIEQGKFGGGGEVQVVKSPESIQSEKVLCKYVQQDKHDELSENDEDGDAAEGNQKHMKAASSSYCETETQASTTQGNSLLEPSPSLDDDQPPQGKLPEQRREMCFGYLFEINEGMSFLARFQILIGAYSILGVFYQMIINPFKSDEKIWLFHSITLLINLPRICSMMLCYRWIKKDNRRNRRGLATSFLVWFTIDLLLVFHYLVVNQILFGTFYKCYIYQKRLELGYFDPKGIHDLRVPSDQMQETIEFVEKSRTYGRFIIWMPMKLYFYYVAIRFTKSFGILDDSVASRQRSKQYVKFNQAEQDC